VENKYAVESDFFFWMCIIGRSPVTADLEAKGWSGEPGCKMSGEFGTVSHLFLAVLFLISLDGA
jgi:hypothetical protein